MSIVMMRVLDYLREAEESMGAARGMLAMHDASMRPKDVDQLERLYNNYHEFLLAVQEHAIEDHQV